MSFICIWREHHLNWNYLTINHYCINWMARIARSRYWKVNDLLLSGVYQKCWDPNRFSSNMENRVHGSLTTCLNFPKSPMRFVLSNRCTPMNLIMRRRNFICKPDHPERADLVWVVGSHMDWARPIMNCLDLSCCYPGEVLPPEKGYGEVAFSPQCIRECNAIPGENPF